MDNYLVHTFDQCRIWYQRSIRQRKIATAVIRGINLVAKNGQKHSLINNQGSQVIPITAACNKLKSSLPATTFALSRIHKLSWTSSESSSLFKSRLGSKPVSYKTADSKSGDAPIRKKMRNSLEQNIAPNQNSRGCLQLLNSLMQTSFLKLTSAYQLLEALRPPNNQPTAAFSRLSSLTTTLI
jgi:hypothetical protein